jgi:hypothetical protein
MLMTPTLNWYALEIAPQREFLAEQLLIRDGFKIWLPAYTQNVRKERGKRAKMLVTVPFIRGYVFAGVTAFYDLETAFQWSFVRSVLGGPDGVPAAIPEPMMAPMRAEIEKRLAPAPPKISWIPHKGDIADYLKDGSVLNGRRIVIQGPKNRALKEFWCNMDGRTVLVAREHIGQIEREKHLTTDEQQIMQRALRRSVKVIPP